MKRLYSIPGIIVSVVFLLISYQFIAQSHKSSQEFMKSKQEISKVLNFNDRLLSARDWLLPEKAWQEKKVEVDRILVSSEDKYNEAILYGYYILIAACIYLCIMVIMYARSRLYFSLTMAFSNIALIFLLQGIMNPILEMGAFKQEMKVKFYAKLNDAPYYPDAIKSFDEVKEYTEYLRLIPYKGNDWADELGAVVDRGKNYLVDNSNTEYGFDRVFYGRTYFYYQNKGILDVIKLLWNHGNKPVAAAIGTFSIIIPSIKLLLTLLILLLPIKGMKTTRKALGYISKWSMADVFVVGAFLAFLSFSNMSPGVDMESNVLFGLYYFAGYVLISISLSFLLDASIKEKKKIKEVKSAQSIDLKPDVNGSEEQ